MRCAEDACAPALCYALLPLAESLDSDYNGAKAELQWLAKQMAEDEVNGKINLADFNAQPSEMTFMPLAENQDLDYDEDSVYAMLRQIADAKTKAEADGKTQAWSGPQNWDTTSAKLLNTLTDGDDEAAENILSLLETMYPYGEAAENEIRMAAGAENLDIGSIADSLRLINGGADSIGPLLMSGGTDGTGSAGNSLQSGFADTTGEAGTGKATEGAGDFIDGIKITDGRVGGKIPIDEFKTIRQSSIKNPDADSMTLGKFTDDATSYTQRAGTNSSYFDLGSEWGSIKQRYGLNNNEMFDYFNKSALDDAISKGKTIRFSHNPLDYGGSFLADEWEYLKETLNLTDVNLVYDGGFWYVR